MKELVWRYVKNRRKRIICSEERLRWEEDLCDCAGGFWGEEGDGGAM